jgi:integrase
MSSRRGKGEGAIFLRRDGRWEARLSLGGQDGRRRRRAFYGRTRPEVARKLRDAQKKIDEGQPLPPDRLTVQSHLKSWLVEKKGKVRPETWRRYDEIVRFHIVPAVGAVRLNKLEVQDIQLLHQALAHRVSGTTAHHVHSVLRAALQDALRWGLVSRNVAALISAPRRTTGEMKFLTASDARCLLEAAAGEPLEALFVLAITAGLREGELQALRWKDVDVERRSLRVTATLITVKNGAPVLGEPKTQKSRRWVYLSELATEALNKHRSRQETLRDSAGAAWREQGLVFTNDLGQPLWRSQVWRAFSILLKKASLGQVRFHDLRHTAASLLLAEGTPVKVVSELLGHSDVKTTLAIYAHVIPGMQEQAATAMDRLLHG